MSVNDLYQSWIAEEERKLRWLIERQQTTIELHYYLVFMLVAHERCAEAAKECEQILRRYPHDFMATKWRRILRQEQLLMACRRARLRWRGVTASRTWGQAC